MHLPATGMQVARTLIGVHAHNIANAAAAETDLVADVVGLVIAKTTYDANAKALAVLAETERALLDVRA